MQVIDLGAGILEDGSTFLLRKSCRAVTVPFDPLFDGIVDIMQQTEVYLNRQSPVP